MQTKVEETLWPGLPLSHKRDQVHAVAIGNGKDLREGIAEAYRAMDYDPVIS